MADQRYDPQAIEAKWQDVWSREKTWEVSNERAGEPDATYVLEMLPYPIGEPHMGHLKCYAIGDAIAHFRRRNGASVLHPMGYDAFGLPAENHAIRSGRHPRETTEESIETPSLRSCWPKATIDSSVDFRGCWPVLIAWFSAGRPKAS